MFPGRMYQHRLKVVSESLIIMTVFLLVFSMPLWAKEEIADIDITLAVDTALLNDEGVPSHLVDVETNKGVVTLSGSVDNLLAKERAEKIAKTVKGVRSVINTIVVKPTARSDAEILSDVEMKLLSDPATESYEIDTTVKDSVVTLSGTVDSWQEKQLALAVAKSVKGIREVKEDIDVEYKEDRPDQEIKAEVERQLDMDVWVDASSIDVQVKDGKVFLSGVARSAAEKSQAYADAWVSGVSSVDYSALLVDWPKHKEMRRKYQYTPKSDEEIKKAVRDAFLYDPRVLSFNPNVMVEDGIVTLTGMVYDLKAKNAAEQDAENTTGVWRVKNYLKVRPQEMPSDDVIEAKVKDALTIDPFVERYEITPVVINGKVYLYGVVNSEFERARAEDVASSVLGVIDVENNLQLDVFPIPEISDWEIRQDIQDELWWSPFVDADQVTVKVDDGVATLTGTVNSWSERRSAQENAYEGGAVAVRNELKVKYGPPYVFP